MQKSNSSLSTPDPHQAEKLATHIHNLEAKLDTAKSPGTRKGELSQEITDNESIIKQRKASIEKETAIIKEALAQVEIDEAKLSEQEEELVVHRRQLEEVTAEPGSSLIAKG